MRTIANKGIKFYFFFAAHHWLPILLVSLVVGMATYGICKFWLKPRYAAKTTIYIGRGGERASASGMGVAVPELNVRAIPRSQMPSSDIEELRNAVVNLRAGIEMITDLQLLIRMDRFQQKVNDKFNAKHQGSDPLLYDIDVKNPKNSRYLILTVSSCSAAEAQELANLMGEVFLEEIENLLGVHNSQVIDYAKMPKAPFFPRVTMAVLWAVFFSAFGTLLCFFLFYLFDSRLNGMEDLQAAVALPVLGEIPLDNTLVQEITKGTARHHIVSTLDAKTSGAHSNISEAFRMLRNNIRYTDTKRSDAEGRVLVITSSVPSEGKSFISTNLSVSFAELGYRTLVINCDLHKSAFHKFFGISTRYGLVDMLSSGESLENCISRHYMDLPLDILPCGPTPPNPAKLLNSTAFRELLAQLKQQYQYIFLDAPPVSAVADTTILGKIADGAVMVARDHYTHEESLKTSVEQLSLVGVEIFGSILNKVDISRNGYYGYGYGYGYSYRYGYGSDGKSEKTGAKKKWYSSLVKFFAGRK